MATTPTKYSQTSALGSIQPLSSPRTPGRLRKLQSAHQLSSNYAASNGPSLIAQQRQQQQRNTSTTQQPPVPTIPAQHSPQRQGRTRSNSDALIPSVDKPAVSPKVQPNTRKTAAPKDAKKELETLMRNGPGDNKELALQNLRHWILCDGMDAGSDGMSHSRVYVWLILLQVHTISTDGYLELIRRGPSPAHAKICNDTFRTFKTNPMFKRRVTDNSLIRLLSAAAWTLQDYKQCQENSEEAPIFQKGPYPPKVMMRIHTASPETYVQGMNVLCAPFLYVARSEPEAYSSFLVLITRECPGYVRGAMEGVHKGIALVDRCLAIVDPILSSYLLSKGVKAEVYAFASVLTLCAGTPPLPEVLHLWDFLFAYGAHLNILCICAQLIIMKEELLASPSPGKKLRAFPNLDAKKIIMLTVALVPKISDDVYDELVHHAQ